MVAGVLTVLGTTSCDDDMAYDFPGDSMNRVFIKPYTGNDFLIVHTPVMSTSSLDFNIPVYVTGTHSGDIQATLGIDNSLVDAYNAAHDTNYEALPEEALVIENPTVTIPAGSYNSSENVHVTLNEEVVAELRSEAGYLIPLTLTSVAGDAAAVSTNMNSSYVIAGVEVKTGMINDGASDGDIQGTMVSDRSGWSVYVEDTENVTVSGDVASAFDGSSSSSWSALSEQAFRVIVDMQETHNVTAINACYLQYGYYESFPFAQGTKMEYSQNGTDWQELGNVPYIYGKNIVLYGPVPMRYVRAEIPVTYSYEHWKEVASITIGEFNVYVK